MPNQQTNFLLGYYNVSTILIRVQTNMNTKRDDEENKFRNKYLLLNIKFNENLQKKIINITILTMQVVDNTIEALGD